VQYYGYNPDDTSFKSEDVRQIFNNYGGSIGFHNIGDNPLNMDFGLQLGVDGIRDINKNKEIHPFLTGWGEKKLENKSIAGAEVSYEYFSYSGVTEHDNSLIGVKPYYKMITDQWSLNAGIETKVDKASNAYVLPDAVFSYDLIGDKFVFVAGWEGHLQVNSFANIVEENPFVKDTLVFKNTSINEIHAGLRGATYGNFSFMVKGYQKLAKDMPFYVTDSVDTKRFDIIYADATIWGGNLELSYFDADRFRVTGSLNVFTFSEVDIIDKPYQAKNFSQYGIDPDVILPENMDYAHRLVLEATGRTDIYFLINQENKERQITATFRTGTSRIRQIVNLNLPAYGSVFVILSNRDDMQIISPAKLPLP